MIPIHFAELTVGIATGWFLNEIVRDRKEIKDYKRENRGGKI